MGRVGKEVYMSPREASLKVEYRDWYPSIDPGTWYPAALMVTRVRRQQREGEPRWSLSFRVLAETHFDFRGGDSHSTEHRTRRTDPTGRASGASGTPGTFQGPTALVIDDESSVRRTIRRALEPEVCNLLEAEDGASGIQIVYRGAPPIDLVLVDLMLPHIDGLEVIETLSRSHPGLPLLCITGFGATATAALESALRDYRVPVLLKPFRGEDLAEAVRALLERPTRRTAHASDQC
jgi:CheY-like chemotaxis protein